MAICFPSRYYSFSFSYDLDSFSVFPGLFIWVRTCFNILKIAYLEILPPSVQKPEGEWRLSEKPNNFVSYCHKQNLYLGAAYHHS